ncbi:MAG: DNA polymerase IV [Planctomycetota bacterium]|nr:DNA polymerase IV [Planctomycetota bacterium]
MPNDRPPPRPRRHAAPPLTPRPRDLMLVDLDCFYVSVERRRDPALIGRPVIVGGVPGERGVVASASYEARAFGVRAGMPLFEAQRRCPPETVFLRGDHAAYLEASRAVMGVLGHFTPRVEPLSADEAFLDLGGCERHHASWLAAAASVHRRVMEETGLAVSIGIGGTRAVARVALALAKPGGVLEVRRGEESAFLADLPLHYLPGVGGKTRTALERFNVRTIGDLAAIPEAILETTFGRTGLTLSRRARGHDAALDAPTIGQRVAKTRTISRETSFARDTNDPRVVDGMLSYLAQRACGALRTDGLLARSVEVRVRYADFQTAATRRRLPEPSARDEDVLGIVRTLWPVVWQRRVRLRLVGVTLHGLEPKAEKQLDLLASLDVDRHLDAAVDAIRERHGFGALVRGRAIDLLDQVPRTARGFRLHTPSCSR